jgi:hypothetical protein
LERALNEILSDEARAHAIGEKARTVVQENLGAIDRTVEMILDGLRRPGMVSRPKLGPQGADARII